MKVTFGKDPAVRASGRITYVKDAHPLVAGGEWRLKLKTGETVNPLLFVGLDAAGEPAYAMLRTESHPNGDYAKPAISSVSIVAKDGRSRRTVHAPEWIAEIGIHVAACRAAFADPDFVTATLAAIGEQEKARRA